MQQELGCFAACLAEFLEAAVHTVLHARGLYHADAFERCRAFNTFTRRARHPELAAYISSTISRLQPLLESGHLRELAVVFFDAKQRPLQRVTFCTQLPAAQSTAAEAAGAAAAAAPAAAPPPPLDVGALESGFGSALVKLQLIDSLLPPLPQGCTFELVAYATTRAAPAVDRQYFVEGEPEGALELRQPVSGQPLKRVSVPGWLSMEVLLEEAARR